MRAEAAKMQNIKKYTQATIFQGFSYQICTVYYPLLGLEEAQGYVKSNWVLVLVLVLGMEFLKRSNEFGI